MIKKINGETWKSLKFAGYEMMRNSYALSSHGRAASYKDDIYEDGKLLKGSLTSGYTTLNLRCGDKSNTLYLHREAARLFHKKRSPKQKYVIHVNHNKTDNRIDNLKWASQKEANEHQQNSPHKMASKKMRVKKAKGLKLNATQVKAIKTILANPKRKLTHKQLADKFKITPMTIYRIKRGENWGSI